MAETSKIEWTDSTFNPWIGCTKVSPGCDNCYAEVSTPSRSMAIKWGPNQPRHHTSASNWAQPLKWERDALHFIHLHGRRRRVFCSSLADVFDNEVSAQWRIELFKLIEATPNLDWLILTKRIGNAAPMLETTVRAMTHGREGWKDNYFPNVWLGISVVNQDEADRDIPKLLATAATKRWLSMEPLLGPVNLHPWLCEHGDVAKPEQGMGRWCTPIKTIDWVVVGGESGHNARPMHPDWAKRLRDQCATAGVPFLFKQWGEWLPFNQREAGQISNSADIMQNEGAWRVGKKVAGRLLDGVEWNGYPLTTQNAEGEKQ